MSRYLPSRVSEKERAGSGSPHQGGFTLVEMLVVITIIFLLAAFLIPSIMNALSRSKNKAATLLIQKIEEGLRAYETDFQEVPDTNISLTVRKGQEWKTIQYNDTLEGQSAQLHGLLGASLRNVDSVDPATGNPTYSKVGPYVNFQKREIMGGEKGNYRKPLVDPWDRVLRVRFDGIDHSSTSDCGSRNNEGWVDIWSEGPRFEEDDVNDGCDEDDINNFGSVE